MVAIESDTPPAKPALAGHCFDVSLAVRAIFGGTIVGHVGHYWNRFDNDEEWDLTSDQFNGDGMHPIYPPGKGRPIGVSENIPIDFIIGRMFFASAVLALVGKGE